jgi:hypothetical protein
LRCTRLDGTDHHGSILTDADLQDDTDCRGARIDVEVSVDCLDARPATPPSSVEVTVTGALVTAAKSTGRTWDGFEQVEHELLDEAVKMAIDNKGVALVAEYQSKCLVDANELPDVSGTVSMSTDGGDSWSNEQTLPTVRNSYQPEWSHTRFRARYSAGLKLRIELVDVDAAFDDRMGTVVVDAKDISEAYSKCGTYELSVAAQGTQILYVTMTVR